MRYEFRCEEKHITEIEASIRHGPPDVVQCNQCGRETRRVYHSPLVKYNCDGFYATDHVNDTRPGDKLERLNTQWSKAFGEKPPPPAKDVARNSGERQ